MPTVYECPKCGRMLLLRQRYVGGHGYGYYLECDECMQGWDAHEITVNLPTMTLAEALERLRKLA